MALAAVGNGQFKGRCFVCGNFGHKSHQCPTRNNKNTQNGQTTQNVPATYNTTKANQNQNLNQNPTANNTNNYVPP